jgi:hypothetical protein
MPNGPCEDISGNLRDALIAITKNDITNNDTLPLVQLAWRTKIFGAAPPTSGPSVCTRADETIACAVVDGSSVPNFWDKLRGSADLIFPRGSLWHARDVPLSGQKIHFAMCCMPMSFHTYTPFLNAFTINLPLPLHTIMPNFLPQTSLFYPAPYSFTHPSFPK